MGTGPVLLLVARAAGGAAGAAGRHRCPRPALLIDRRYLDDWIALLEERGQIIFYGPPGTGKTFVAQALAEAIAPDPTRRMIVQFHPSTSVPFFPDRPSIAGLLSRWLDDKNVDAQWVAELMDMVNGELVVDLGGPHLQIGPSHFMRKGMSEDDLRRVWDYSVYPFIEDQLYGERDRIARYGFARVSARFRKQTGGDESAFAEEGPEVFPEPPLT